VHTKQDCLGPERQKWIEEFRGFAYTLSYRAYVRGVLGNKCAGQHILKMVHFRETLASGNFLACSSAIRVFFSVLYLPYDGGGKLLCNNGGGNPLQALLEGAPPPWVNKQLASSDFTFRRR
jgi:hypothetical protein